VPLQYPRVTSVNVYLVALTDGWLLVDTGTDLGSLQTALAEAGAPPDRVRALLVTHPHPDHSALAAALCDLYGWPLLRGTGPVTAVDPLRDPRVPQAVRHAHCRRAGVPEADLALMADAVVTGRLGEEERRPADLTVAHGDALDGLRARWEVVGLPGHSPGQIGLWDVAHRRLIAADLAYPIGIPFIEWGDSPNPYAEQLGSLERASALKPAVLYPGHGRPDPEPELRIERARGELAAVSERLVRAVASRPSTAYELACGLAPTNADPDVRQSHLATTLAILDHQVADGRVAVDGSPLDGDRPRVYSVDD
jgi:glyoxylase-like metal-dependent hydrolase (beta-lactamase superfamily II)